MSTAPPRPSRPSSRLVAHEVRLIRKGQGADSPPVIATIYCERRDCPLEVEECATCERFARVDVHEAGYVMLCRSTDEKDE